ncbi:neocarzinostatin apoprotein domain-containing protein [Nocardia aurantia]|uniref:Neocarzinostatin family protein n=1 Tax=Nocardia aurantia TaxID=2585199 RepID=A0A7K0DJY9_9NOCA|nr:neocarzinostatin apoprotein domain-containing protein [Nocardia aurantia]MQY26125.1 hypothetical protein [Nocardia aurantia]
MIRVNRRGAVAFAAAVLAAAPIAAAPAMADPAPPAVLHVSATTDLADGQRITVSGSGFQPGLPAVAVGLCRQNYTNGLTDCDLGGGAGFVNIAADGTFKTLTLTLHPRFKEIDCLKQQCEVAAAPLPGTQPVPVITANTAVTPMAFAGATFAPPTTSAATAAGTAASAAPEARGPSVALWSVTAGLLAVVAGAALADRRRL